MVGFAHSVRDDDIFISEELIARLHHASEDSVLDLVSTLRASERANLAMHCYRKSHLREEACGVYAANQRFGPHFSGNNREAREIPLRLANKAAWSSRTARIGKPVFR